MIVANCIFFVSVSIESTGALSPAELFEQSIDILMEKSSSLRKELAVGHDDPMDEGNNIA